MMTRSMKDFIKAELLKDMPRQVSFSFNIEARNLFEGDTLFGLHLTGSFENKKIFDREEAIDFENYKTQAGMIESSGTQHGFPGLGIIYMRNLAIMLRDNFEFDVLTMRAGSHSGAAVWASCGFVLNYPYTSNKVTLDNTKQDLIELRDAIEKRVMQDPDDYRALNAHEIIKVLDHSIAQGYVDQKDENILWRIADFGEDGMALLGALRYQMKLDLYDPIQMERCERRAHAKITQREQISAPVKEIQSNSSRFFKAA